MHPYQRQSLVSRERVSIVISEEGFQKIEEEECGDIKTLSRKDFLQKRKSMEINEFIKSGLKGLSEDEKRYMIN